MSEHSTTETATIDFDASCHSADAIQRAAYAFTDRFALDLASVDGVWRCTLHFVFRRRPIADIVRAFRVESWTMCSGSEYGRRRRPFATLVLALAFSQLGLDEDPPAS